MKTLGASMHQPHSYNRALRLTPPLGLPVTQSPVTAALVIRANRLCEVKTRSSSTLSGQ